MLLIEALKDAKARNPLFSLRAMARQLDLSPSHLSQLLSGKRPLTLRVALSVADHLEMSERDRAALIALAATSRSQRQPRSTTEFKFLGQDEFHPISSWHYFAILSLGELRDNRASARWIATRLGISFPIAKEAYEKLKILGYIEERGGKYRQVSPRLHSQREVPNASVRKYHKQNLELARDKIDAVSIERREFTSMTMAVDSSKLARAKKLIHDFKLTLSRFLETGEVDDVYTIAIQLFPLTEPKSKGVK